LAWSDLHQATLEQSAAHHQRLLREMSRGAQEKLEALCFFEAVELLTRARGRGSGDAIARRLARLSEDEHEDMR